MKFQHPYIIWIIAVILAGCTSSSPEHQQSTTLNDQPKKELPQDLDSTISIPEVGFSQESESSPFEKSKPWKPRFIQTGLSSGIMIEFTGMKKGKKLSARYANMELRRYLSDANPATFPSNLEKPTAVQASINDLQQAFFKVSEGKYVVRLTNEWADRSYIRDVEVKDGEYSVLTNDVYGPWLKMKQLSDSTEER